MSDVRTWHVHGVCVYSNVLNMDDVCCACDIQARQSLVLLKNGNAAGSAILPLKKGIKLALVGPHTQTQKDLAGNYFEDIGLGTCAGK